MDIQAIIDKVAGEIQKAPELLKEFTADPGAAVQKITGEGLGDIDIAAVAEGVLAQMHEKGGDVMEHLSGLMQEGAVHDVIANITAEGSKFGDMLSGLFNKKGE